jgi:hypothetical protein
MRRWFISMKIKLWHKLRKPNTIMTATAIVRAVTNVKRIFPRSARK